MHIGYLTPEFPHYKTGRSGGLGTSIWGLVNVLSSSGIKVSVFVYGKEKDEYFVENNVSFYLVKNIKIKWFSYFLTVKKIQKLISNVNTKDKIDFLEVPDWTGFSAFLKLDIPIVMRLNGSDTYFCHLENRPVKFLNKFLEKRAYLKADYVISVSEFTGKLTNKLFKSNKPFVVIPNPVDTSKFFELSDQIEKGSILYFGTLIRKKGLFELPLIFNQVIDNYPNAFLYLVGSDSYDIYSGGSSTWELIKPLFSDQASKNVKYLGSVDYSIIKNYIGKANVCVFPSFAEALPVSWLEAMAMGKAIVTSDIGWASEVIDQGIDGYMVNPKNHFEFSQKIVSILEDDLTLNSLSKNAKLKVNVKFSEQKIFKSYIDFYKKLV